MSDYDKNITRTGTTVGGSGSMSGTTTQFYPPNPGFGLASKEEIARYEEWRFSHQTPSAAKLTDTREGIKHDQDKAPLDLLSSIWLLGVAKVMGYGAKKYAAHNWRKGLHRSRLVAAALRHLLAYNSGEDNDPETVLSHLDHASCCLMFAREQHETHPHLDDRYRPEGK